MKTQTYINFKNFVKTNCVIPYNDVKKDGYKLCHHYGDTAHAIYSAWYIFKHNLTAEAAEEYIKTDFQNTHKKFTEHGCYINLRILKPDAVLTEDRFGRKVYADDQYILNINTYFSGDAYISEEKWKEAVMAIYDNWKKQLDIELAAK